MAARAFDLALAARWLTRRPRSANKGDAGRVLIVAGSRGMAGAAVLAALGAVRGGAGLTKVATVRSQQAVIARRAPLEVTSAALPEDGAGRLSGAAWPALAKLIASFRPTVIAFGPGVGRSRAVEGITRRLAYASRVPLVLDADGLNALAALGKQKVFSAPAALTPHPGEMARLLGRRIGAAPEERVAAAREASRAFGAAVLLKGAGTVVTDGRAAWKNTTGGPAMASGGMGDVLTGLVAATWAQMPAHTVETAARAAALGAFAHGLAGDIAEKDFPERTLIASDLAAALPQAFKLMWRRSARGGRR